MLGPLGVTLIGAVEVGQILAEAHSALKEEKLLTDAMLEAMDMPGIGLYDEPFEKQIPEAPNDYLRLAFIHGLANADGIGGAGGMMWGLGEALIKQYDRHSAFAVQPEHVKTTVYEISSCNPGGTLHRMLMGNSACGYGFFDELGIQPRLCIVLDFSNRLPGGNYGWNGCFSAVRPGRLRDDPSTPEPQPTLRQASPLRQRHPPRRAATDRPEAQRAAAGDSDDEIRSNGTTTFAFGGPRTDDCDATLAIARECPAETRGVTEAGQTLITGRGPEIRQSRNSAHRDPSDRTAVGPGALLFIHGVHAQPRAIGTMPRPAFIGERSLGGKRLRLAVRHEPGGLCRIEPVARCTLPSGHAHRAGRTAIGAPYGSVGGSISATAPLLGSIQQLSCPRLQLIDRRLKANRGVSRRRALAGQPAGTSPLMLYTLGA